MSTKYQDNNNNIETVCPLSNADKFPCYEILSGNANGDSVNLVCSSSHFVRMEANKYDGKTILKKPQSSRVIENFIEKQRKSYYNMLSSEDKEQFENFISFINIEHPYGSAISLRILIENFFKENFISPALNKLATEELYDTIFSLSKNTNSEPFQIALHILTFRGLIDTLWGSKPNQKDNYKNNNNLKYHLMALIHKYVTEDNEGRNKNLSKNDLATVYNVFTFISGVVHGKKYNSSQIFEESQPFFEILGDFYNKSVNSGDVIE